MHSSIRELPAGRMSVATLCTALSLLLPVSAAATGETDPDGDRVHFSLGIGAGYAQISTGSDTGVFSETATTPDDFTVGMAFALDLGYRTDRNDYVEFIFSMWNGSLAGELGNEDWYTFSFAGAYRWYPTGEGLYLRAGFGTGLITAELTSLAEGDEVPSFNDYGLALLGAVGYDISVTERFEAGPRLDASFLDVGDGVNALVVNGYFTFNW